MAQNIIVSSYSKCTYLDDLLRHESLSLLGVWAKCFPKPHAVSRGFEVLGCSRSSSLLGFGGLGSGYPREAHMHQLAVEDAGKDFDDDDDDDDGYLDHDDGVDVQL